MKQARAAAGNLRKLCDSCAVALGHSVFCSVDMVKF